MVELKKSPVVFIPESHEYLLAGVLLHGVTSTLIKRAFPDKYKGVSEETLAKAAKKGHDLHESIEFHDHFGTVDFDSADPRIAHYERLKEKFGLTTIANEYLVSDERYYASQIDIVALDRDGNICLIDTKTTYELDKASTGLQLSIYKWLFELQNPDLKVERIFAMWLPNRDANLSNCFELSIVDEEIIDKLIDADQNDEPFQFEKIPDEWAELERAYRMWAGRKEIAEETLSKIKDRMIECMTKNNLSTVRTGTYTVSFIPEKTSQRFDSAAFKKAQPDMYKQYMKESQTAASLRVVQKKQEQQ